MADDGSFWVTLKPNRYHQPGDRKPVANGFVTIEDIPLGDYKIAAWRGRKNQSELNIKFTLVKKESQEDGGGDTNNQQASSPTPPPPPQSKPEPPKRLKDDLDL